MRLEEELDFAVQSGRDCITDIRRLGGEGCTVETKPDGTKVTNIDMYVNRILTEALKSMFPNDGIISEETPDDDSRFEKDRVWIIDPIDGTDEIIRYADNCARGRDSMLYPNFAVHIGMAYRHQAVLGVVACPATGELFYAVKNNGAFLEKDNVAERIHYTKMPPFIEHAKIGVNPSNLEKSIEVAERLGIKKKNVIPMSSVGVRICAIAKGEIDCYISMSRATTEWDLCAPHVIAKESGLCITDQFGKKIEYNTKCLTRESVFVAPHQLHAELIKRYIGFNQNHSNFHKTDQFP